MVTVVHVVGLQGVGKSTLIESMAASVVARGLRPDSVIESDMLTRAEALAMCPGADMVYLEYSCREAVNALPGEAVITMERVLEPKPRALNRGWDGKLRIGEWLASEMDPAPTRISG